ncbi:MAG: hypothetical protein FJW69_00670 [Actinobacteria bacterium]|nr:hypothetical protein [Actinomycetota bacterium]
MMSLSGDIKLSIANISQLSEDEIFLLQISKKSEKLSDFIKAAVPKNDKNWLSDLKSWEIKNKWIKDISDICIEEYEQVFFDFGKELLDLKNPEDYRSFKEKILSK